MTEPAIRLTGLRKSFGPIHAVTGVDLEIADGEFFSMLGPSGSGKTTVLRLIAGFELPTAGTVTLVAVGPLTNLALAEIKHPGLLQRVKSLLVMGGAAFRPGNVTRCAEFNFHADPLAADTVMNAGPQVQLFGLDVTSKAAMSQAWIASLRELDTRSGRAAHAMLQAYAQEDPLLHDACPVAWLLEPALFSGEPCAVRVNWRPGFTEGQSCTRPMSRSPQPERVNAMVYTDVECARLLALVRERLARLP